MESTNTSLLRIINSTCTKSNNSLIQQPQQQSLFCINYKCSCIVSSSRTADKGSAASRRPAPWRQGTPNKAQVRQKSEAGMRGRQRTARRTVCAARGPAGQRRKAWAVGSTRETPSFLGLLLTCQNIRRSTPTSSRLPAPTLLPAFGRHATLSDSSWTATNLDAPVGKRARVWASPPHHEQSASGIDDGGRTNSRQQRAMRRHGTTAPVPSRPVPVQEAPIALDPPFLDSSVQQFGNPVFSSRQKTTTRATTGRVRSKALGRPPLFTPCAQRSDPFHSRPWLSCLLLFCLVLDTHRRGRTSYRLRRVGSAGWLSHRWLATVGYKSTGSYGSTASSVRLPGDSWGRVSARFLVPAKRGRRRRRRRSLSSSLSTTNTSTPGRETGCRQPAGGIILQVLVGQQAMLKGKQAYSRGGCTGDTMSLSLRCGDPSPSSGLRAVIPRHFGSLGGWQKLGMCPQSLVTSINVRGSTSSCERMSARLKSYWVVMTPVTITNQVRRHQLSLSVRRY